MPVYTYLAKKCQQTKEVLHSMSEVGDLSKETVCELRCEGCQCEKGDFKKEIDAPTLLGFRNGTSHKMGGSELGNIRRETELKKRADQDFKKNVLPTISDPVEKNYHKERLGD